MLYHASQRAGLPLPRKRQYTFSGGKPNYYVPYDGIFLPNSNSFWCGIIHHENYKEKECFYIVFSPEGDNTVVYQYVPAKASQLMKAINNYDVEIPKRGTWLGNSQKYSGITTTVVIKDNLQRPFLDLGSFDLLPNWSRQCDWLSTFMGKAQEDIEQFRVSGCASGLTSPFSPKS